MEPGRGEGGVTVDVHVIVGIRFILAHHSIRVVLLTILYIKQPPTKMIRRNIDMSYNLLGFSLSRTERKYGWSWTNMAMKIWQICRDLDLSTCWTSVVSPLKYIQLHQTTFVNRIERRKEPVVMVHLQLFQEKNLHLLTLQVFSFFQICTTARLYCVKA